MHLWVNPVDPVFLFSDAHNQSSGGSELPTVCDGAEVCEPAPAGVKSAETDLVDR